jgi:hypothetical protein
MASALMLGSVSPCFMQKEAVMAARNAAANEKV